MPDPVKPLPLEIVAAIDVAFSDLERTVPRVSSDRQVRSEVEAAVGAALASLDRVVPEVTEGETRRALAAFEAAALAVAELLAGLDASLESSAAATKQAMEELGQAAVEAE